MDLKTSDLFLLSFWLFLSFGAAHASNVSTIEFSHTIEVDTVKYRGYRLALHDFEVVKKTDDWLKLRFGAVNTGRMEIDMDTETMHWVQINFDQSLFDQKLGGYRDHIQYQLAREKFKLGVSEKRDKVELKIPVILPAGAKKLISEPISKKENKTAKSGLAGDSSTKKKSPTLSISPDRSGETLPVHPNNSKNKETPPSETHIVKKEKEEVKLVSQKENIANKNKNKPPSISEEKACPDIYFSGLRIVEENSKWATLEYSIKNNGDGIFHLFETEKGKEDGLVIRAYISGVEILSRGALPIGGQVFQPMPGVENELKKGDEYQARIKLDVRKKTRYMKSLILKLDGGQYAAECDRKNNTGAVILE